MLKTSLFLRELNSIMSSACAFYQHRTLLLNADYKPLGFPLETLNAEDTIRGMFLERLTVVTESDVYAHSPSCQMRLPSVVALKEYVNPVGLYGVPSCNLHNLFVRERGLCAYSLRELKLKSDSADAAATIDHVISRAEQGEHRWDNVVLASWSINNKKGAKRPEQAGLTLQMKPWVPTGADLLYLWLTEDRLATLPVAWREHLQLVPTTRLQRVLAAVPPSTKAA
ncbi:MAG: HNH endonuclease [Proteobacteria bacterium]|nr:HNH endonuclease [Pseudomonadota bacterium]